MRKFINTICSGLAFSEAQTHTPVYMTSALSLSYEN